MNNGSKDAPAPAPVLGLHHNAYRCRDAEETRHFYEDVLGLPLVHVVKEQFVPSTGEKSPFAHLFFELKDGSCIAFFDLGDNVKPEPSPNTPAWVTHFAMKVPSVKDVETMKARLEANGVRLEFTAETASSEEMKKYARDAHASLAAWTKEKAAAVRA